MAAERWVVGILSHNSGVKKPFGEARGTGAMGGEFPAYPCMGLTPGRTADERRQESDKTKAARVCGYEVGRERLPAS